MDNYRKSVKSFIRKQEKLSDRVSGLFETATRNIVTMLQGQECILGACSIKLCPLRCNRAVFTMTAVRSADGCGRGVCVEAVLDDTPANQRIAPLIGRRVGEKCRFLITPDNFTLDQLQTIVVTVYCQMTDPSGSE